jgi:PAS domain S-box-containing protein
MSQITGTVSEDIKTTKQANQYRTRLIEDVKGVTESIKATENQKIIDLKRNNSFKKILICILLFIGSFLSMWVVLSQAIKIIKTTKDIINTSESLSKEINLREDLEKSLQDVINIYDSILNSSLDGIIIIDKDHSIIELNSSIEDMFSYHQSDLIGRNVIYTLFPTFINTEIIKCKRMIAEGISKDGRSIGVELIVCPIKSDRKPLFSIFVRQLENNKR